MLEHAAKPDPAQATQRLLRQVRSGPDVGLDADRRALAALFEYPRVGHIGSGLVGLQPVA